MWCHGESVRKLIETRRALVPTPVCVEAWDREAGAWREVKATAADMATCGRWIEEFVLSRVQREAVRPVEEVEACGEEERNRARLRAKMRW